MPARIAILSSDVEDFDQPRVQLQRESSLFVRLTIQFQIEARKVAGRVGYPSACSKIIESCQRPWPILLRRRHHGGRAIRFGDLDRRGQTNWRRKFPPAPPNRGQLELAVAGRGAMSVDGRPA